MEAINQGPGLLPPRPKVYIEGSRKATMSAKEKKKNSLPFSASAVADLRCFDEEKEKNDVSSPRGVIEACIKDFDHEPADDTSSNNSSNEFRPSRLRSISRWRRFFKLWKGRTFRRLPSFPPFASTLTSIRRKNITSIRNVAAICRSGWKNFTLSELEAATDNFSQDNLIGTGGFAEVFKGRLPDGQLVAIKRLNKGSEEEQSISFLSEIGIIAHLNHPNTAKMIGFGVEGGTYLLLRLSSLGSLATLLHGSESKLAWDIRHKIVLGTANGLLYLHENCQRRIIHRDIKADNILLTEDFEPQICDFGLAKWLPEQLTHHNVSTFEGTFGYFAPEYITDGIVDEKTDVFSFGVLLLELITRKKPVDETQQSLVLWAKPLLDTNDFEVLVDPTLCNDYDRQEMECVILIASLCIEHDPTLRPTMSKVVNLLKGNDGVHLECPREDRKKVIQRMFSEEILDVNDYNSTKCLRAIQQLAVQNSSQP